jgi:uncharacterized protein involved in exopolysaccharide biosynthesis
MSPKQLFVILLRRSWIIAVVFISVMTAAGVLVFIVPPRYDAVATGTIDPSSSDPVTGQSVSMMGLRVFQGNLVALAKSQKVAVDVVRRLGLTSSPQMMARYRESDAAGRVDASEWIAAELLRGLEVKFNEGTNVIVIAYKSSNPVQAAQVANTFMVAFMDAAIEAKVAGAQQTAQWFEPQTQKLWQEAEEARVRMSRFQTSARLAPNNHGDTEMGALQLAGTDLANARAEVLKVRSALAQGDRDPIGDTASVPFDSQLMQSLKGNLASVKAEINRLQTSVGASNPKLTALNATRQSLEQQIAAERKEVRKNLEARLQTLEANVTLLEKVRGEQLANVINVQEQRNQLATLQRDWELKHDRYLAASKAASSARLQGQLSFSNIVILDRATTPVSPSFPKPMLVIPAAMAAGLGLGMILSLIAEALDRRIRAPRDLDFAVPAPNLGTMLAAPVGRQARRRQKKAVLLEVSRQGAG